MHEFESINQTQTQITDWSQVRYLPGPDSATFSAEEFSVNEMLVMILGVDEIQKLRLRHKTNSELFTLYTIASLY